MAAPVSLLFLFSLSVYASFPQVDFDRMGTVGLAGAFAGLDLFSNASSALDPSTATLLSRAADGSLAALASTNSGGAILAGCRLNGLFYLAGNFSTINAVPAANIASYSPSSGSFASLGSNSPNGQINSIFCDPNENKVWAGGLFSSPGSSIAIYDPKSASWSSPPFTGLSGALSEVNSITSNSSDASLFFAGSFITSFGDGNVVLNGTNNPNVPFSAGASPFSSSLVPLALENADIDASPSSTKAGFSDIHNTLCPSGSDGSGNSWFAADNSSPLITVRTFSFISAAGVRLGNTFQVNHGTTGFSVTTIPDNTVRKLKYVDPTTGQNQTCTDPCPLSTDSSILYQDFLFDSPVDITGAQIQLSQFTGSAAGLHILQILSSGAFVSALDNNNTLSCFAPNPSNSSHTGDWTAEQATTGIPGTVQTILVSTFPVGTPSSSAPTFRWIPYVSASGIYDINLLVPGCNNFLDCGFRTSVTVTVFPGAGLAPFVTNISQQNLEDATVLLYSGPILPSSPNFVATIDMALAETPAGTGQNGQYEMVADRVQFLLRSATVSSSGNSTSVSAVQGLAHGFGFLEWPRSLLSLSSSTSINGRSFFPNTSLTSLDTIGFNLLNGLGGASSLSSLSSSLNAVVHHSSGLIVLGGKFALNSGPISGSSNVVGFRDGALVGLSNGGLNGEVKALVLNGNQLYVGGAFTDTLLSSTQGRLSGIALYDVDKNSWSPLLAGVNGVVASVGVRNNQVQITGNFTKALSSPNSDSGLDAAGFAVWDITSSSWVNSGGFVIGKMTFVGNDTSTQFIAGNIAASQKFGATGLVMLKNGDSNGPNVAPFSVGLRDVSSASVSATGLSRRSTRPSSTVWISHLKFSHLFGRQTNSHPAPLSSPLPASAPAVLAGAFWTNSSSSKQVTVIGGNFSFPLTGSSSSSASVAIYNQDSSSIRGLTGPQVNGTVRALLIQGNVLYIGGEFTIAGTSVNGLASYDLLKDEWDVNDIQALQPNLGSTVVVRSISVSTFNSALLIVAGSFLQAGSLRCEGICSFDTTTKQWNALGSGIQGEVASVVYAGDNESILIAAGSISLSDNTLSNVVQFSFANSTWTSVGLGSDLPGPISAFEINSGNTSSMFAAGKSIDGSSSFLSFWNGSKWATLGSSFNQGSTVAQLTMVPLQASHGANGIIEADRMLMILGALSTPSGKVSSALYDGQNFIPYITSTSASGTAGSVSSLFHSFTSFSFNQRRFLATGVVILISIAIAAGVVFFLALIGILWTLFSRKDDKLSKFDTVEENDDDSTHHRPSSLLEHINAATRTTILGTGHFGNEEEKEGGREQDPFGPDASNYVRAETPSDAVGGLLAEETSRPAHARYSFDGTGEGELPMASGAAVEVLDDRDPAWWYARDVRTGKEGVVPAAYLY